MGIAIAEFSAGLAWAESLADARGAFRRFAAQAGIECYTYASFTVEGTPRHVDSTYPEPWIAHYIAMDYSRIDPVIGEARRSTLPFSWRSLTSRPSLPPDQRRLFAEAARHGIVHGYTLPFRSPQGFAMLSIAFNREEQLHMAFTARPDIKTLASYYHNAVERLLQRRDRTHEDCLDGLSEEERQSLSGIAAGQTLWQIAATMRLPENNVGRLLRTARLKLGSSTTAEAVTAARNLGLI